MSAAEKIFTTDLEERERALTEVNREMASLAVQIDQKRQEVEETYRLHAEELSEIHGRFTAVKSRREVILMGVRDVRRKTARPQPLCFDKGVKIYGIEDCE